MYYDFHIFETERIENYLFFLKYNTWLHDMTIPGMRKREALTLCNALLKNNALKYIKTH